MRKIGFGIAVCAVALLLVTMSAAQTDSRGRVIIDEDPVNALAAEPSLSLESPKIVYPEKAAKAGIVGVVNATFVVSKQGSVDKLRFISGRPILRKAVAEAVRSWKYSPRVVGGKPVAAPMKLRVQFLLENRQPLVTFEQDNSGELLIHRLWPSYPPLPAVARIQGSVVIDMVLEPTGRVKSLSTVNGHPMLVPAAIDALKQWKFKTRVVHDEPVEFSKRYVVKYELGETAGWAPLVHLDVNGYIYPPSNQIPLGSEKPRLSNEMLLRNQSR